MRAKIRKVFSQLIESDVIESVDLEINNLFNHVMLNLWWVIF